MEMAMGAGNGFYQKQSHGEDPLSAEKGNSFKTTPQRPIISEMKAKTLTRLPWLSLHYIYCYCPNNQKDMS